MLPNGVLQKPLKSISPSAGAGNTGSDGAVDDPTTSRTLPGGATAVNPGGDIRALAASLPSLVRSIVLS